MLGLETHHGSVDGARFLKVDKIGTLFLAWVLLECYDVSVHVSPTEFVQNGHAEHIAAIRKPITDTQGHFGLLVIPRP